MTTIVLETQVSLADKTYYRMGGTARYFVRPQSLAQIQEAVLWAKDQSLPIALLGSGSNCVFADGEFAGLVLSLEQFASWHWESENVLYAEAGISNTEIAEICLNAERTGASWMYRMPGQLGATVRMNARCYGGEISQIVTQVVTLNTAGRMQIYSGRELFLGYKNTLLMQRPEIVVAVRLTLHAEKSRADLLAHMEQCEFDRHGKHHFDLPSCGSTFKNNYAVGKPSGRVFDECGLKGARVGGSAVSDFHANFVWNTGGAKTSDMLELAAHMRKTAWDVAQADLELEVQPIGCFAADLFHRLALERLGPSVRESANEKWTGLLWHPSQIADSSTQNVLQKSNENSESTLECSAPLMPFPLLSAPFLELFRTPFRGKPELRVEVRQLKTLRDARAAPDEPFLEWQTYLEPQLQGGSGFAPFFPLQPEHSPQFLDELWKYSVSEIFFANGSLGTCYFEFEMTPAGHWIALAFDSSRVRNADHVHARAEKWPGVKMQTENSHTVTPSFGMIFSYRTLANVVSESGQLLAQCALSLGNARYFIAPHWKSGILKNETWDCGIAPEVGPNFHQPERFWRLILVH